MHVSAWLCRLLHDSAWSETTLIPRPARTIATGGAAMRSRRPSPRATREPAAARELGALDAPSVSGSVGILALAVAVGLIGTLVAAALVGRARLTAFTGVR